jgi:TolA-binding protein
VVAVRAAADTKQPPRSSKPTPASAQAAVEAGLFVFHDKKDYGEAVRLFKAALDMDPPSDVACAALFNLGCAYAKQRNFKEAAAAIGSAVNNYNLKLSVALKVRPMCGCVRCRCRSLCARWQQTHTRLMCAC